uniref:Uncharacterized protein n=1 Tax=Sphaerodactylus townsendi TaxID=933632 RepID=A0ACB8G523_9SAUR
MDEILSEEPLRTLRRCPAPSGSSLVLGILGVQSRSDWWLAEAEIRWPGEEFQCQLLEGWGNYGIAAEEELHLTEKLFWGIFDSLSHKFLSLLQKYDPELFRMALPCLSAIAGALPPDYLDTRITSTLEKQTSVDAEGNFDPKPISTVKSEDIGSNHLFQLIEESESLSPSIIQDHGSPPSATTQPPLFPAYSGELELDSHAFRYVYNPSQTGGLSWAQELQTTEVEINTSPTAQSVEDDKETHHVSTLVNYNNLTFLPAAKIEPNGCVFSDTSGSLDQVVELD